MAKFVLNLYVYASNNHILFEILYEYCPDFTVPVNKHFNIFLLNNRLDCMVQIRKEAEAALYQTKDKIKADYKKNKSTSHIFKVKDKIWLLTKNIAIHQKT